MKFKIILLLISGVLLCFSCRKDNTSSDERVEKTRILEKNTSTIKENTDYWSALQAQLELNNKEIKALKSLKSHQKQEVRLLKKEDKLTPELRAQSKKKLKDATIKLLGKKKNIALIKFNKEWNQK
jgi:hypothetical protein